MWTYEYHPYPFFSHIRRLVYDLEAPQLAFQIMTGKSVVDFSFEIFVPCRSAQTDLTHVRCRELDCSKESRTPVSRRAGVLTAQLLRNLFQYHVLNQFSDSLIFITYNWIKNFCIKNIIFVTSFSSFCCRKMI